MMMVVMIIKGRVVCKKNSKGNPLYHLGKAKKISQSRCHLNWIKKEGYFPVDHGEGHSRQKA